MHVLSVKALSKRYGPTFVVDHISFDLKKAEVLGLLGPNGSGKTTTIQMLLGTLNPTSGLIDYFGLDFSKHRSKILKKVSFASTYNSLPGDLTLKENLEVIGYFYGLTSFESRKRYEPLLERFQIADKKNERSRTLSAGQMTRLMLVKAFFVHPEVVLLDEPTASLDPDVASDVCSFILEEREKKGVSVIFCSHKMDEVMEICDRALFLKKGKIIADDLPLNLARSVSKFRIRLVIEDGLKRLTKILQESAMDFSVERRLVEFYIQEEQIARFLSRLSEENVIYANIKIEEPSLEEFFLRIAKGERYGQNAN